MVLADNLFGDLLGDMGSGLVGSVGLPANALLGPDGEAVFELGHGSAPNLAGRGIANPIACIRALALLLRLGLQQAVAAAVVEDAIAAVLACAAGCDRRFDGLGWQCCSGQHRLHRRLDCPCRAAACKRCVNSSRHTENPFHPAFEAGSDAHCRPQTVSISPA